MRTNLHRTTSRRAVARLVRTAAPAWWAAAQAAMDTHVIFARIGVLADTDRTSDAGTAIAGGAVDILIDSVTLVPK